MAVTEPEVRGAGNGRSKALAALTAAALMLPGLGESPAALADPAPASPVQGEPGTRLEAADLAPDLAPTLVPGEDQASVSLQVGRYQEGKRTVANSAGGATPNPYPALRADTLRGQASLPLNDDNQLGLSFGQDTWSGATPVTTAPLSANTNRPVYTSSTGSTGSTGQLTLVGASPMLTGHVLVDRNLQPVTRGAGGAVQAAPALAHTLVGASQEVRQEGTLTWQHRLADGRLDFGGGASNERDVASWHLRGARRFDSEDRLTSLTLAAQYGQGSTHARFDHDAYPYITRSAYQSSHGGQLDFEDGVPRLQGKRQDAGLSAALVQVLGRGDLLQLSAGYSRAQGYLGNPYKLVSVLFANPAAANAQGLVDADLQALLEQRPALRRQWQMGAQWLHYHPASDGALRLSWSHQGDDWGIRAHSLEAEWRQPLGRSLWLPRLRYSTQTAASFYTPYLVSAQAYRQVSFDAQGNPVITPFNPALLPENYSSDTRLGGFGSLSLGLGVITPLAPGLTLEAGLDLGRQAGALKWGGGNRLGDFADLRYALASLALRIDLDGPRRPLAAGGPADSGGDLESHGDHSAHRNPNDHGDLPAGVNGAHLLAPGQWMMAYRYELSRYGGPLRHGNSAVDDATLVRAACDPGKAQPCYGAPGKMSMGMHMVDLMVGLKGGWTLMVMPQYTAMTMDARRLDGAPTLPADAHLHTGTQNSAGLGDTTVALATALTDAPRHPLVLSLGLSLPTGNSGLTLPRSHQQDPGYLHYDMQPGSGTWDFLPALTWTHQQGPWQWGAQARATLRLQSRNAEGYARGNQAEVSAWVSHPLGDQSQVSLRLIESAEGPLRGAFNGPHPDTSSSDYPSNSGYRRTDLALGLATRLGSERLALAWQRPLASRTDGYQLPRTGLVSVAWEHHF